MTTRILLTLILILLPIAGFAVSVPEGLDESDWRSIQAQVAAHQQAPRFRALRDQRDDSYVAANPVHGFEIRYTDDGTTELEIAQGDDTLAPAHEIALKPVALGYGDALRGLAGPASRTADGERVNTVWDSQLREWWVNSAGGLEQWFELAEPPAGRGEDPLRLELDLDTTLNAKLVGTGDARHLLLHDGATRIRFEKLLVEDATGHRLPARMKLESNRYGNRLAYVIDDRTAVYPLTIDPTFVQQAYLKASNTEALDEFGWSVAISGDTVVVGARLEDSDATGVDGDQSDNSSEFSGAAYVFVRSGVTWSQQAYLKASNIDASDQFGFSVAISGDTLVVGAPFEDSNATGVDGGQGNNLAEDSGAAYIFLRSGSTWSQQAYIKASNTEADDQFGHAVAISGDTVVVSAYREDSSAPGVNGDQSNNSSMSSGAVYVFQRTGTTWSQQAYLKASNPGSFDNFGGSVAISDNTVVVGAVFEDSNAIGVNGDQANNLASIAGAAYVFVRSGTNWSQQAYLKASNTDASDLFGASVAVSDNTVVVGAFGEDSNATGVNGDQTDNSAEDAGAAYVFIRSGSTWSQQAYLKASNTDAEDVFGDSVEIDGDTVVVGAWRADSNATGIDGDQSNNLANTSGAAYVFSRAGTTWSQAAYLKSSNSDPDDGFGRYVSVSGDIVLGAIGEGSSATGVNGDQTDNSASFSGAAYVFDVGFTIGGNVAGLAGTGLVLQNNGGDDLAIAANGSFTFASGLLSGSSYDVTVLDQPTSPSQTCNVANGSGTLASADVTNVTVTCATDSFTVGGTVSGLTGDQVVLQNNGGDDQVITANGAFTFTPQTDGTGYSVTVSTQPGSPSQTCTVANGSGTLSGADVTDVAVTCVVDQFLIGGTVTGLTGDQVVLQNNGGDDQVITADGGFLFAPQDDGTTYDVTVLTQPVGPIQTCSVANGSGTLAGASVSNVEVTCVNEPPAVGLSADGINFGAAFSGDTVANSVTITNTGTGDLVISGIGNPSAPFDVTGGSCFPLPTTLLPSETCDIELTFTGPSTFGNFSDDLTIVSNAASSPDTVALSGTVQPLVIPTLDRWGLLMLVLMMSALAWYGLRGQRA